MFVQKHIIENRDNHDIVGVLTLPKNEGSWPLIIGCHGFYGTKEFFAKQWNVTLQLLHEEGYGSFVFDFTNNLGESYGALENITVGQEVSDLEDVLSYFWTKQFVQKDRIGILGFSLGGMVELIVGASSPKLAALVALAPVFNFDIIRGMQKNQEGPRAWQEKGSTIMHSSFLDKYFKVKYRFYEEGMSYNMPTLVSHIKSPTLVIQGDHDEDVPLSNTLQLMRQVQAPKDLKIIEGADHGFATAEQQRQVANSTLMFLNKHLKGI